MHPLPPLQTSRVSHPGVLARLLDELGGNHRIGAAARLFRIDPGLALLALRALASTDTPPRRLADLDFEQAITRLDPTLLKNLVIAHATGQLTTPPISIESLEANWRRALATAHFARALAARAGYPGLDEAWLAGLLCWLPRFGANGADSAEQLQTELDALGLDSFLADVLRYLTEPARRLVDAAPLVRLVIAAYRQTMNYPAWIPAMPHPDTLSLAAPIDLEAIRDIHHAMSRAIDTQARETGLVPTAEIARALARLARLELLAARHAGDPVAALAGSLAGHEGLRRIVFLRLNRDNGLLESVDGDADPRVPPISLRPEGSTTAAAWALLTRAPVVVPREAPADAAVLDLQLIRLTGAEGIAALPIVGAGADAASLGVLLIAGKRESLAALATDPRHYQCLAELTAAAIEAGDARPSAGSLAQPTSAARALSTRVRDAVHEISNPLGIIKNYLALARARLGADNPIQTELRILDEETERCARIVRAISPVDDETAPIEPIALSSPHASPGTSP